MMLRLLKLDTHTLMSSCTKLCDTKNIKKNFSKLKTNVEGIKWKIKELPGAPASAERELPVKIDRPPVTPDPLPVQ